MGEGFGIIPLTSQPSASVGLNTKEHCVGGTMDGWVEGVAGEVIVELELEVGMDAVVVVFARALQSKQPSS